MTKIGMLMIMQNTTIDKIIMTLDNKILTDADIDILEFENLNTTNWTV